MPPAGERARTGRLSPAAIHHLLEQARAARAHAYAPYSRFPVGAALQARDGRIFTGVNVENASYGLTTCAERTAVVSAMAAGARDFVAIAVAGPDDRLPCPTCGSGRQILHESAPDLIVVTSRADGGPAVTSLRDLLPGPFDGAAVRRATPPP